MEIRRAVPGDADALTGISFAAKRHWNYPERWMDLWRDALTITPEFVLENEVFVAVADGDPAGFYALVGDGRRLDLEHLWVSPDRIGTGLGRVLFGHAVARAIELGAEAVEIESDPNAEGFYSRMGARRAGENVYEIEGHRRALPVMVVEVPHEGTAGRV